MEGFVSFEQIVFQEENKNEIENLKQQFRKVFSKFSCNTLNQILNFDLIEEGYQWLDFIINDDINETALKKIEDYIQRLYEASNDKEFKELEIICKEISKNVSRNKDKNIQQ